MAMSHNSHDDRVLEALTSRSVPAEDQSASVRFSCRAERAQLETSPSRASADVIRDPKVNRRCGAAAMVE